MKIEGGAVSCNCHSYNWDIGEKPEAALVPPEEFGLTRCDGSKKEIISIDACIAHVIQHLWDKGVVTLNCCCGHGRKKPGIIFEQNLTIERGNEIRAIISEVDQREFQLLSWVLTEV